MKKESTEESMNNGLLTTVEFIPKKFFRLTDGGVPSLDDKLDILRKLCHINFEIELLMDQIEEVEITGCLVQLRDETNVHFHFAIGKLYADIPEKKDMLCVKYGNKKNKHCTRCHVERYRLGTYSKSKKTNTGSNTSILKFLSTKYG